MKKKIKDRWNTGPARTDASRRCRDRGPVLNIVGGKATL